MFRKILIKHKVYFLAIFGAVLSISITLGAIYAISGVSAKLEQVADEDIPMTSSVTAITLHQLEQAVYFERASKYAQSMAVDTSAKKGYEKSKKYFLKMSEKVNEEIKLAEELVAHILQNEVDHAGEQKIIDEFKHIEEVLLKVGKKHKDFDGDVAKAFMYFEKGALAQAYKLSKNIETLEDALDHELESLLLEIESFTEEAAVSAKALEAKMSMMLTFFSLIATLVFVIASLFIVRGIIKPLLQSVNYAGELSDGKFDANQPKHYFEDEIADMLKALTVFKANGIEANELRDQQAQQGERAEEEKRKTMNDLAEAFDVQVGSAVNSLAAAATELQATAEGMKVIADETNVSSATVARSSEESSMNVNTVASAMEEMVASSGEIAMQISSTKDKSNDTASNAQHASETVGNLNELATNIGEVVVSIQDIAEQTNLLALNATIEAARAGDAGKGFAVVADEVKKLATETAQKTSEINDRINEIQGATRESVDAMERIISNISEIDDSVIVVSAAVEEQNATTSEITRSINEASQGSQKVSEVISTVQKGAEQTGESVEAVLGAASELANLSENLKGSVDQFLNGIRS